MSHRRRRRSVQLTPLELEVMDALWTGGASTVQAVKARMPSRPPLAYNTVQTVLGILHKKGQVTRKLAGRSFVYTPVATRYGVGRLMMREMLDNLFSGSPADLVMSVIDERIDRRELRRIRRLIKKYEDASD